MGASNKFAQGGDRNGEAGQAMVEYALIISLISVVSIIALGAVGTSVNAVLQTVADALLLN
jgi:Flp pilus assembly pilin Flp